MNHTTNPQDAVETARALLWRHGLPEDVIDGALCLHAQELAAVQRRDAAVWGVDTAAGKHILGAADLIDPTRAKPAVSPSVVVSADRATLRDRIAEALAVKFTRDGGVTEGMRVLDDSELPVPRRPRPVEVADALLAVLPASEAVCICGHSKQQHFEDVCITEITGCNCGDYLEPQDAAEVIDRWRQAALQARATDRATLLREAATRLWHQTSGLTEYGRGARWAVAELRAMADCPACGVGVEHDVHGADGPNGVAAEEQPTETQDGEVDADTVAKRAAQVISTMGADIRTLTQERNRYRNAWHNARARASDAEDNVRVVEAETQCGCGHAADEHSVYGCVDGCGCDRMVKRPPMDPVHILGIDATRPAVAEQPDTQTREAVTVHAIPLPGSNGISSCCGRPPCEFVGERLTRDPDEVTCPGPPAP